MIIFLLFVMLIELESALCVYILWPVNIWHNAVLLNPTRSIANMQAAGDRFITTGLMTILVQVIIIYIREEFPHGPKTHPHGSQSDYTLTNHSNGIE